MGACPFCNLSSDEIIGATEDAYLIKAKGEADNYLILPREHITRVFLLPALFMNSVVCLLTLVPYARDELAFNLSLNHGRQAGQRLEHLHFWVIDRTASPDDGLGLATLVAQHER